MNISVVIATYNRAPHLAECLGSLRSQRYAPGDEIVVADNGSTDGTPLVLRDAASRLPVTLRTVVEPRPGKSCAVTAAVAATRADVLAFTDDDVLVEAGWLDEIRRAMTDPGVGLVGGRVLPRFAARVPDWLDLGGESGGLGEMAAPLALLDYGPMVVALGGRAALGANLAVRRSVFDACGGFDPALGKLRGTLLSGEDHQLCERVQAAGHLALYDPAIVVRHLVPAERLRLGYFARWFYWSGVTHARMQQASSAPAVRGRVPPYLVRRFVASTAKSMGALATGGCQAAAGHAMHASFAAGYVGAVLSSLIPRGAGRPDARRAEAS